MCQRKREASSIQKKCLITSLNTFIVVVSCTGRRHLYDRNSIFMVLTSNNKSNRNTFATRKLIKINLTFMIPINIQFIEFSSTYKLYIIFFNVSVLKRWHCGNVQLIWFPSFVIIITTIFHTLSCSQENDLIYRVTATLILFVSFKLNVILYIWYNKRKHHR